MTARRIAACAAEVALLVAVQYVLSFVAGLELVTVFLLCFCYAFGVGCGMLTATAFSLVRCLLFGFSPTVVLLYLLYYNLFALAFGLMGKREPSAWAGLLVLGMLLVACGYFAVAGLPAEFFGQRVRTMLWALFAILSALFVLLVVLLAVGKGKWGREIANVTAFAAFFSVCFTLLDDAITPLFYGFSAGAAEAYFYSGFLTMLPQTICVCVSVFVLFLPLKEVCFAAAKRRGRGGKSENRAENASKQ